jgi:MFS family permease
MINDLMQTFSVGAAQVVLINTFFYWPYMFMQLPVGMIVDRYGAQKMILTMTLLFSISCFIFGGTDQFWLSCFSRFLMGFSASFAFVSTLKMANLWLPSHRFGLVTGITQSMGMLGAACGGGPAAWMIERIGWQKTVIAMGFVLFGLVLLMRMLVYLASDISESKIAHPDFQKTYQGFQQVMRNPETWWNGLVGGCLFGPTLALGEFWGVECLKNVHQISQQQAASAISMLFIGWGIGGPCMGAFSDFIGRRKPLLFTGLFASVILLLTMLFVPLSYQMLCVVVVAYGFFNSTLVVSYAVAGEINHLSVTGISLAFSNLASVVVGAAILQPLIGIILTWQYNGIMLHGVPYFSGQMYQNAMLIMPVILLIGLFAGFRLTETFCRRSSKT